MPESRIARADRRSRSMLQRLGAELRVSRSAAGLTQIEVAAAVGLSPSELSRIERGDAPWADLGTWTRIGAIVGLDVWVRTYPAGEPLRDAGQLRLGEAFASMVGPPLVIRSEVRVGDAGDLRAWDMTLTDPGDGRCGVELETRFVDAQAQHRRISLKASDSGLERVLVVVADTRANRAAVRAAAGLLGSAYALEDPAAIEALAAGRLPPRSALIFVPFPRRGERSSEPAPAGFPSHGSKRRQRT